MDKATCIAMRDDRTMLLNEAWWPFQFPLPSIAVKHRTITISGHPHGLPRTGRMVMTPDGKFCVHQWRDENPLEFGDTVIYETVDDVLTAGWIVD